MIIGDIKNWQQFKRLEPLAFVFGLLEKGVFVDAPVGKHPIEGDRIYALVIQMNSKNREMTFFESHRKYVDVQFLLEGEEYVGVMSIKELLETQHYDEATDTILYKSEQAGEFIKMTPERFLVLFPEDGHMPGCYKETPGLIKKVVVKVAVDVLEKN